MMGKCLTIVMLLDTLPMSMMCIERIRHIFFMQDIERPKIRMQA